MSRALIGLLTLLGIAFGQAGQGNVPELTYQQRLDAQRAIARVYYSHQQGATRPFDEAVPDAVVERQVRTHLSQSVALEEFWKTPITPEALAHEWERIVRNSRLPDRLREIQSALGGDQTLLMEELVRPVLVHRLARSFFASDQRIHAESRREAEDLQASLASGQLDPRVDHPHRHLLRIRESADGYAPRQARTMRPMVQSPVEEANPETPSESSVTYLEPEDFARLRSKAPVEMGEAGPVIEQRDSFTITVAQKQDGDIAELATYVVPKRTWDDWWNGAREAFAPQRARTVWTSVEQPSPAGSDALAARTPLCIEDDTWDNGALDDMPEARHGHTAAWTGSLMLVYGGKGATVIASGARYDPLTDTWSTMSTAGAPRLGSDHASVWTGSVMVVWGGINTICCSEVDGARYDPLTDTWSPISDSGFAWEGAAAVWTGTRMLVWGGGALLFDPVGSGAIYDPAADQRTAIPALKAPTPRFSHSAVWTGREMIVWGGSPGGGTDTGARFDPVANTWTPMSTVNAPQGRMGHSAVWTGREMVVWGGLGSEGFSRIFLDTGGRYDPVTDTWAPITTSGAPEGRHLHSTVWTGSEMIVWGGSLTVNVFSWDGAGWFMDGAKYDPLADRWTPIAASPFWSGLAGHSAIWTGTHMILWGGADRLGSDGIAGARYDPVADTWTPTADSMGGPPALNSHAAVWTGTQMIVWGGTYPFLHSAGGRYDPLTDSWNAVAIANSPSARTFHGAVWTGSEMIVWGGSAPAPGVSPAAWRYDPLSDAWSESSVVGAPQPRQSPRMVWTGSEVIAWGGFCLFSPCHGARYEPASDTWRPLAVEGAPADSVGTAVWTGNEMIVWGRRFGFPPQGQGGRYNPLTDTWTPTSVTNAPLGRTDHAAVWTGREMIIWGGSGFPAEFSAAGRYDPVTDSWALFEGPLPGRSIRNTAVWTGDKMVIWGGRLGLGGLDTGILYDPETNALSSVSRQGAPFRRYDHTAVWTGSTMLVWGGRHNGALASGGRYAWGHSVDDDLDGYSECEGDCGDADASVYPGATQVCGDRANNDCLDPRWPALTATNEADDDGDSFSECGGDCDDTGASAHPGAAEACNGLDDDCDGATADDEADQDRDGFRVCQNDCDDARAAINPGAVDIPGNTIDENCDGAVTCDPTGPWKNRGELARCVARECAALVAAGRLTSRQCGFMVREAAPAAAPAPRPAAASPERNPRVERPVSPAPSPP